MNRIKELIESRKYWKNEAEGLEKALYSKDRCISEMFDEKLELIDRIAELENHIEKLAKRNQDLSDTKYAMHKAYRELEMDLESAEHEIALCHQDIKKLNQKINLKNYLIDKLSRAIMLISK